MVNGSRRRGPAGRATGELRKLRPLFVVATFILVTAVLYWARTVLIPIAVATLLAFLLTPVVTLLQRRGLRRSIAVALVVVMAFSVLGGVGWILTDQVWSLAEELPQYRYNIRQKAADLRKVGRGGVLDRLQRLIDDVLGEIQREESTADRKEPVPVIVLPDRQGVLRQLPGLVAPLVTVALVLALVVFMLGRQVELRTRVIRLIGYGRLPRATKALDEAAARVSQYLLTLSAVNGIFAAAVGTGLFLIGVPYAVLWGFLAGALRFVPYVGAWLAALLPLTLALAMFHGWMQPLLVLGLFLFLEPLIFLVIEPLLYRTRTGVSDLAVLVAVLFWSWLWGPVGLLLATPLTVCVVVLAKYVPDLEFLGLLLGEVEPLDPDLAFYQRLLAGDEDEATEIVEEFVRTHPPEQVYDTVLLAALKSLKRDRARGALTEDDARFVLSRTREIAEELAIRQPVPPTTGTERLRLLACPARDEVDEVALTMFRQLVDGAGWDVEVASSELLSSEVVTLARATRPAVICIATVPPGGLAHVRYLVKRLRAAVPEARIVVGRWGKNGMREEVRPALLAAGADEVGMSMAETRDHVLRFLPVLTAVEAGGTRLAGWRQR